MVDELPILLSLYDDAKELACARCLAPLGGGGGAPTGCPSCRQVAFCSPACAAAASQEPWVHAPATCEAYARGLAALPESSDTAAAASAAAAATTTEARSALRFLIQALALRALAQQHQSSPATTTTTTSDGASRYARLMSLCVAGGSEAAAAAAATARALLPALAAAVGGHAAVPPEEEVAALLSREQANSFAVEQTPVEQAERASRRLSRAAAAAAATATPVPCRRRLLGGALYAQASLVNHECLPNVARFDDFAEYAHPQGRLKLVALHTLPKGTELALCYVPLRWPRSARRAHCARVYGFSCACARCALEAREDVFASAREGGDEEDASEWETDEEEEEGEWDEEEEEGEDEGMEEAAAAAEDEAAATAPPPTTEEQEAMDPTYLHLFLLKYACGRKGCTGGTLAPERPGGDAALRCNACGARRTEAEFLAELQQGG